MKIAITSDHAGVECRQVVREEMQRAGHEMIDLGSDVKDAQDYPDFALRAAQMVAAGEAEAAVCICGTGIGMSIAANKVRGIRAAVAWDEFTATVSRTHNNANVLCLGARVLDPAQAARLAVLWAQLEFEGGRHARRVDKISDFESSKS